MVYGPPISEMTLNEYVHEHTRHELPNGECIVVYEPLENLPCNNIIGEVYIDTPELSPRPNGSFIGSLAGSFVGSFGHIRYQPANLKYGARPVIQAIYNERTGVIRVRWDKYPGEHVMRVSYDFGEIVEERLREGKPTLTINWQQEGF